MVELDKLVQRSEALKRLRSLFDMHRVAFGDSGNLADVLKALHHDRHFAMDFWGVVGGLCSGENASLTEEEIFSAVVESATGVEPSGLGKREHKAATELRDLLAGIDVEAPEAIERPSDELLDSPESSPHAEGDAIEESTAASRNFDNVRFVAPPRETPGTGVPIARRSIGETLARLEETSRELREQLASIEGEGSQPEVASGEVAVFAADHAPAIETVQATEILAEIKPLLVEEQGEFSAEPKSAPEAETPTEAQAVTPEIAPVAEPAASHVDQPETLPLAFAGAPQAEEANAASVAEPVEVPAQPETAREATAAAMPSPEQTPAREEVHVAQSHEETPVSAAPKESSEHDSRLEPLPVA